MRRSDGIAFAVLAALSGASPLHAERPVLAPVPAIDASSAQKVETAIFAGGCFWGVEGVFSHVKGVRSAVSGFAGGPQGQKVDYERVSQGGTGFAEAVRVTYDPKQVSYGTLLRVFFSVIADPTTLNRQGPDRGTQYRSALFPLNTQQDRAAKAYLGHLNKAGLWRDPIVTRTEAFTGFQAAGAYHQNFLTRNPRHPYIQRWDMPKLAAFKAMFPKLYQDRPAA
ncbi:peptide-methionine (S)-S-oxide reductase MsrA [Sphingobium bisphenolivorans]|uniref:peptide-methionine (S)-S-oxide reductase MsrA n=1 Tax=Sphingobium bisphenolivorans TaxID=1335760 RepID=UPI00039C3F1C|nr:peptide-methionine (S)-S-oxide reductase MsrA [Sphingobium bisphenolivorans]